MRYNPSTYDDDRQERYENDRKNTGLSILEKANISHSIEAVLRHHPISINYEFLGEKEVFEIFQMSFPVYIKDIVSKTLADNDSKYYNQYIKASVSGEGLNTLYMEAVAKKIFNQNSLPIKLDTNFRNQLIKTIEYQKGKASFERKFSAEIEELTKLLDTEQFVHYAESAFQATQQFITKLKKKNPISENEEDFFCEICRNHNKNNSK